MSTPTSLVFPNEIPIDDIRFTLSYTVENDVLAYCLAKHNLTKVETEILLSGKEHDNKAIRYEMGRVAYYFKAKLIVDE